MEEILHQLIGNLSHYLQDPILVMSKHPGFCIGGEPKVYHSTKKYHRWRSFLARSSIYFQFDAFFKVFGTSWIPSLKKPAVFHVFLFNVKSLDPFVLNVGNDGTAIFEPQFHGETPALPVPWKLMDSNFAPDPWESQGVLAIFQTFKWFQGFVQLSSHEG